jgi:hypothetical protein
MDSNLIEVKFVFSLRKGRWRKKMDIVTIYLLIALDSVDIFGQGVGE